MTQTEMRANDKVEERWPKVNIVAFAAPHDAQAMAKILNNIHGELEGLWAHIRNLEQMHLNPNYKPFSELTPRQRKIQYEVNQELDKLVDLL